MSEEDDNGAGEKPSDTEQPDGRAADPFTDLAEDVEDREGDPFAHLDDDAGPATGGPGPSVAGAGGDGPGAGTGTGDSGPAAGPAASDRVGSDQSPTPGGPDEVADVDTAGERTGDPFESARNAFEAMDVGEIDADAVWDDLVEARARGSVTEMEGTTYAEVSKHAYCETCEYFSTPPEVACSHEGTQILEYPDIETVRVADCPVVAERRELEQGE